MVFSHKNIKMTNQSAHFNTIRVFLYTPCLDPGGMLFLVSIYDHLFSATGHSDLSMTLFKLKRKTGLLMISLKAMTKKCYHMLDTIV